MNGLTRGFSRERKGWERALRCQTAVVAQCVSRCNRHNLKPITTQSNSTTAQAETSKKRKNHDWRSRKRSITQTKIRTKQSQAQ
jgi:hypothetical protein